MVVTGEDDTLADGSRTSEIEVSVDASSGTDWASLDSATVAVTTLDDEIASFSITETDNSTDVQESGTTDSFDVVLDTRPEFDVVLNIVSDDTDEATVDLATLTFTNANWNTAQTVVVSGEDDVIVDGFQTTSIDLTADASSGSAWSGLTGSVTVTTSDDDEPGFTVTPSNSGEVTEGGSSDMFEVVLNLSLIHISEPTRPY